MTIKRAPIEIPDHVGDPEPRPIYTPRPTRSYLDGPKVRQLEPGPPLHDLPPLDDMLEEMRTMTDILMGRAPTPKDFGVITLMEVADAYYARGCEMTMYIQDAENDGTIPARGAYAKFRTGSLRTFCELAKRAADLGSRRLTFEQLRRDSERRGRES